MEPSLSIGEVARRSGVDVETLRFYERRGLLQAPARSAGGWRVYSPETVLLVRRIKAAQRLGFTLAEIERVVSRIRRRPGEAEAILRAAAGAKLGEVDRRMEALRGTRISLSLLAAPLGRRDVLHVTNGDAVRQRLEERVAGRVIPWRDVLHDGPVPGGIGPDELRRVRARFIADCGWARFEDVVADLLARDAALSAAQNVVLWFERDLYDQLQLVQVVAEMPAGVEARVVDLGEPREQRLPPMDEAVPVTPVQRRLARRAWAAFRSPDPVELAALAAERPAALPFLAESMLRLLEELPAVEDGLARTERQALEVLERGARSRHDAFVAQMVMEARPFLGETSFWLRLERLGAGPVPLVEEREGRLALTGAGRRVLAGEADQARLNGLDRWLGGMHLAGTAPAWRWSRRERRVVAPGRDGQPT